MILTTAGAAPIPAREWISAVHSGYSSSYHTQSWFDTLHVGGVIPAGMGWEFTHRLDLLRKERASGPDLEQRTQRGSLRLRKVMSDPLGWTLNVEGEESAIAETFARRSMRARTLAGLEWTPGPAATVTAEAGFLASRHTARDHTDDVGLAERFRVSLDAARPIGLRERGIRANAQFSLTADHRSDLAAREAGLSWRSQWEHPEDTIALSWLEDWVDTRFYPTPDQFENVGRQERRSRSGRLAWTRAPNSTAQRSPLNPRAVDIRVRLEATADRGEYRMFAGDPVTLPNNIRSGTRGYQIEGGRSWGALRLTSGYRYRWSKDRYGESRRDQTGETGEWTAGVEWGLRPSDSVGARVVFRATSYSVPGDSSFFDDRDQGERVVEIWCMRRMSEVLTIRPVFSFRSFRQIFISEQLSANNNTDDVYLLMPTVAWTPHDHVEIVQRFAIRAHYRFFDYERKDPQGRGTLYRRAESSSTVRWLTGSRSRWYAIYTYRYEDFGGLYDREGWVQAVDWDRRSHLIDLQLQWSPARGLSIDPGIGIEYKRSFNHRRLGGDVVRFEGDLFRRHHIMLGIVWRTRAGVTLDLRAARRVQRFGVSQKDRDDRWQFTLGKEI